MPRLFLALLCTPLLLSAQGTNPAVPSTVPAPAPAMPVLTAEQTATIMKQLEQLEGVIGKSRTDILGAALTKFKAALAGKDVLALYLECYKLENFERRDLKTADFLTWKEANEDKLKDKDNIDALTLQLEYLVLTIQAQDITEQKDMGPTVTALQAFIPKAMAAIQDTVKHTASGALEAKGNVQGSQNRTGTRATGAGARQGAPTPKGKGGGQGNGGGGSGFVVSGSIGNVLRQSVKSTEFAKAYLLEDHLTRENWTYSPLDIPDIYENVIFPYYLAVKPTEIGTQWDNRINAELNLRKLTLSETEFGLLAKERQPELAWQKANFMLTNNLNPLQAMADMLKVVRENPTHPRAVEWLKTLRDMVNTAQPLQQTANPGATAVTP
jgi:hypothetical protein